MVFFSQFSLIVATSFSAHRQTDTSEDMMMALHAWHRPRDHTGYGHTIIASLISGTTTNNSKSPSPFYLTVPKKTEGDSMTNRQLSMAMTTWNIKESGYKEVAAGAAVGGDNDDEGVAAMDSWDPKTSDYFSERNSFEVDDEDVTAAVGYCKCTL